MSQFPGLQMGPPVPQMGTRRQGGLMEAVGVPAMAAPPPMMPEPRIPEVQPMPEVPAELTRAVEAIMAARQMAAAPENLFGPDVLTAYLANPPDYTAAWSNQAKDVLRSRALQDSPEYQAFLDAQRARRDVEGVPGYEMPLLHTEGGYTGRKDLYTPEEQTAQAAKRQAYQDTLAQRELRRQYAAIGKPIGPMEAELASRAQQGRATSLMDYLRMGGKEFGELHPDVLNKSIAAVIASKAGPEGMTPELQATINNLLGGQGVTAAAEPEAAEAGGGGGFAGAVRGLFGEELSPGFRKALPWSSQVADLIAEQFVNTPELAELAPGMERRLAETKAVITALRKAVEAGDQSVIDDFTNNGFPQSLANFADTNKDAAYLLRKFPRIRPGS